MITLTDKSVAASLAYSTLRISEHGWMREVIYSAVLGAEFRKTVEHVRHTIVCIEFDKYILNIMKYA